MMININKQTFISTFFIFAAIFTGLFIGALPVEIGAKIAFLLLGSIWVFVILLLPNVNKIPSRTLLFVFGLAISTYFLWPPYAYIPINSLPTKNPQRMIYGLMILFFFVCFSISQNMRSRLAKRVGLNKYIVIVVCTFFFWRIVTAFFSNEPLLSAYTISTELVFFLLLFFITISVIVNNEDIVKIINWLIFTAIVICIIGLYESRAERNIFEPLITVDKTNESLFAEVLSNKLRDGQYRIRSTLTHPLVLAEFLASCLPLLGYKFLTVSTPKKFLLFVFIIISLITIYFTRSRSPFIVITILFLLFSIFYISRAFLKKKLDIWSIGAMLIAPLLCAIALLAYSNLSNISSGRSNDERTSSLARQSMTAQSIPLISDSPIVGYGPGYGGIKLGFIGEGGRITLDNYYLAILLDSGLLIGVIFSALLLWLFQQYLKSVFEPDYQVALLRTALVASALSIAITKIILGTDHNMMLFYLFIGLLISLNTNKLEQVTPLTNHD